MYTLLCALQLLTRVPVRLARAPPGDDRARAGRRSRAGSAWGPAAVAIAVCARGGRSGAAARRPFIYRWARVRPRGRLGDHARAFAVASRIGGTGSGSSDRVGGGSQALAR